MTPQRQQWLTARLRYVMIYTVVFWVFYLKIIYVFMM